MNHPTRSARWRFVAPLLAAFALSVGTLVAGPAVVLPPILPAASAAFLERPTFSAEAARAHLSVLTQDIGARVAGTPAHEQAVAYVADTWRGFGYTPTISTFPFTGVDEGDVSVTVSESGDRVAGSNLRGGPAGEVSAELVDAGLGRTEDVSPSRLTGRIALVRRGEIRFSEKIANVADAGAVGVVIDNSEPGPFAGALSWPAPVPAIGISQEDGRALRRQLGFGPLVVQLRVEGATLELSASNVEAVKPGSGHGVVIIGAHIDSVNVGQGANDNGSGTAVLTELARSVADRQYPFEIRFVAFGAEEIGLLGSRHYVEQLTQEDRGRVIAMVNLDMVGVGSQWRMGGSPNLLSLGFEAIASIGETATRMGPSLGSSSDHASFIEAGMPGLFVHRTEDPNYHTSRDRMEQVDPRHLDTAGQIVLAVLELLARGAAA